MEYGCLSLWMIGMDMVVLMAVMEGSQGVSGFVS